MVVDRTKEFEDLLVFFSPGKKLPESKEGEEPSSSSLQASTDFAAALSSIAAQFEQTKRHIEKLQKLVDQRSSFYKEPTSDIEALSALFDSDDKQIEVQLQILSAWLSRNTPQRSQRRKHGETIIDALRSRRTKLAQLFQTSLKKRTEVLKRKVRRQSQFGTESSRRRELSLGTPLFTFPMQEQNKQRSQQHSGGNEAAGSGGVTKQEGGAAAAASGGLTTRVAPIQENRSTMDNSGVRRRRQGQQQQMSQLMMQEEEEQQQQQLDSALKRRSTARGIESEIEKLGEVFQRFSALVVEQGETLRIIDTDIEAAQAEVEEGQTHIANTYNITKGNRGTILKVFATVIVLGVILVIT